MGLKPISTIKAKLGIEPNGRVQRFFTNTCRNHMEKYVPLSNEQNIHLRENVELGVNYVKYKNKYAHAQYIGVVHGSPVKNYTTPRNGTLLGQKNGISRNTRCNKRNSKLFE